MGRFLLVMLAAVLLPRCAQGEALRLAEVFQDSMVLQCDADVSVWGTAAAGTTITVTFAGQQKTVATDMRGRWMVKLEPMEASTEPRELTVAAEKSTLVIRDILVGEVWIAAGQSNMEWPLKYDADAQTELPAADAPQIRLLNRNYAGQNFFAKPFSPEVLARLTPGEFYRGTWQRSSPRSAEHFSAVAYYFAKEVYQARKTPVGVIHLAVGGSPAETWIRREAIASSEELASLVEGDWLANEHLDPWCRQRGRENLALALNAKIESPRDDAGLNHPFKPAFLWEAGIAPLVPLSIRGVIWYQGESNAQELWRVQQHERLFPLLVADWRKQWGIGDFPFLYCQLSSIGTEHGYKSHHWPEFRDCQRRLLTEIPNTGMAVTSDVGHPTDVHPRNKKAVGQRLALWALANVYRQKLAYSGPLPVSLRREGSALVVKFDHADRGLTTSDGKAAAGFEIAGVDGVFQPAVAEIGTDAVTLSSDRVAEPQAARYAWRPFSNGNLTSGAGLPASTFLLKLPRD